MKAKALDERTQAIKRNERAKFARERQIWEEKSEKQTLQMETQAAKMHTHELEKRILKWNTRRW